MDPTATPPVTVIVPCFNDEAVLPGLLARLRRMRAIRRVSEWRFLFVDDGSTDDTFAELLHAARDESWVAVIRHPEHAGVGAAVRTGFAHATSDIVCTMDCACTYPPERLPELVAAVGNGADVATAPDGRGGRVPRLLRTALNRMLAGLPAGRIGGLPSLTCMFRAYRREVTARVRFRTRGAGAMAELMLRALFAGYAVHELPISVEPPSSGRRRPRAGGITAAPVNVSMVIALTAGEHLLRTVFMR